MDNPISSYWTKRLFDVKTSLESNNFDVFIAGNRDEACKIVLKNIMPPLKARTISWGGSMTFKATGLYKELKNIAEKHPDIVKVLMKKLKRIYPEVLIGK